MVVPLLVKCIIFLTLTLQSIKGTASPADKELSSAHHGICSWSVIDRPNTYSFSFLSQWLLDIFFGQTCQHGTTRNNHECVSAEFSKPIPTLPVSFRIVAALPFNACSELNNGHIIDQSNEPIIVMARRGDCSFMTKANNIKSSSRNSWGIVIIDTAEGSEPMPMGGDLKESPVALDLVSVMVGNNDATSSLIKELEAQSPNIDILKNIPKDICYTFSVKETSKKSQDMDMYYGDKKYDSARLTLCNVGLLVGLLLLCFWVFNSSKIHSSTNLCCDTSGERRSTLSLIAPTLFLFIVILSVTLIRFSTTQRMLKVPSQISGYGFIKATDNQSGGYSEREKLKVVRNFNHRENDEIILHYLADSVKENGILHGYTLKQPKGQSLIEQLKLSKITYDKKMFHHPPCFVLISNMLQYLFQIPHVLVPVMLSIVTTLVTGKLGDRLLSLSYEGQMWAVLLHLNCPLTWWCSQKYWLDNALALMASVCFLCISNILSQGYKPQRGSQKDACKKSDKELNGSDKLSNLSPFFKLTLSSSYQSVVYASLFFSLAMWCKITAVLIAPALIVAVLVSPSSFYTEFTEEGDATRLKSKVTNTSTISNRYYFVIITTRLLVALAVALVVYGPWLIWYRTKVGLWMPPAIPTSEMLANSPFVKNALLHSSQYYVRSLIKLSPVYILTLPSLWYLTNLFRESRPYVWEEEEMKIKNGLLVLWCWVFGMVGGMTYLGAFHQSGFQLRFILPVTSPLCLLTAFTISRFRWASTVAVACVSISAMHCLYYGIMFAPLYADIGSTYVGQLDEEDVDPSSSKRSKSVVLTAYTVFDMAFAVIGRSDLSYPLPDELLASLASHLSHFGVTISA